MLVYSDWNEWLFGTGHSQTCGGIRESLRIGFDTLVWWWLFMLKKRIRCSNQRINVIDWITGILCNATENDWTHYWHVAIRKETKKRQTWPRRPCKRVIHCSMFSLIWKWSIRWNPSREWRRLYSGDYPVGIYHKYEGYTIYCCDRDTKTGLSYFSHHAAF